MKAWQIFVHSIRQVFGNLPEALQISGLIYLAQMAASIAMGAAPNLMGTPEAEPTPGGALAIFVSALIFLLSTLWIAVAWHRFVLTGERPAGYVPALQGGRVMRYAGRSILIALVVIAMAGVLAIAFGGLYYALVASPEVASLLTVLSVMVPILTVLYRLSAVLPGVALDRAVGFADGWVATTGESGTILTLAFLSGVASIVMGIPLSLLAPGSLAALLWEVVAGWIQVMVSASILTTLYGHYIEKRPLV